MIENRKDIAVKAASTTRTRAEWRRPEYRKLEAREAEVTNVSAGDLAVTFS